MKKIDVFGEIIFIIWAILMIVLLAMGRSTGEVSGGEYVIGLMIWFYGMDWRFRQKYEK